jgi:hypothetical protein
MVGMSIALATTLLVPWAAATAWQAIRASPPSRLPKAAEMAKEAVDTTCGEVTRDEQLPACLHELRRRLPSREAVL